MSTRGLRRADVAGVSLGFMLLVPLAAQVVAGDRERRNQQICAANLRGLAQSINVYAADNADAYPIYAPTSSTTYSAATDGVSLNTNPDKVIAANYDNKAYGNNNIAAIWLTSLMGMVAPRQFICPSDPFAKTPASGFDKDKKFFTNFQAAENISYSSPFPWTMGKNREPVVSPLWRNMTDASQPVFSDMAPYLGQGGKEAGTPATRPAGSKEADAVDATWAVKKANSQNHGFEGQNVAFGDAHAEFFKDPAAGQNNDSIWGLHDSKDKTLELPIEPGELTHPPEGAAGAFDIVMIPVRDAKGAIKGAKAAANFTDLP